MHRKLLVAATVLCALTGCDANSKQQDAAPPTKPTLSPQVVVPVPQVSGWGKTASEMNFLSMLRMTGMKSVQLKHGPELKYPATYVKVTSGVCEFLGDAYMVCTLSVELEAHLGVSLWGHCYDTEGAHIKKAFGPDQDTPLGKSTFQIMIPSHTKSIKLTLLTP